MRHDVTFPLYVEVDEIYHLACPASPVFYQRDPVQTTKTSVHGLDQHAGPGQADQRADPAVLDVSEVYGDPAVHPQPETYWGNVNPIGIRVLLRRGQAVRRDAVLRLPAAARHADQGGADLQHLRPGMHPDDGRVVSNFIVSALNGEPIDDLRRRQPDPVVLLRRRPGRRAGPADGHPARGHRPDQPRQPERVHHDASWPTWCSSSSAATSASSTSPLPSDDPTQRQPDITQAREILGWPAERSSWPRAWPSTIDFFPASDCRSGERRGASAAPPISRSGRTREPAACWSSPAHHRPESHHLARQPSDARGMRPSST